MSLCVYKIYYVIKYKSVLFVGNVCICQLKNKSLLQIIFKYLVFVLIFEKTLKHF